VSVRSRDLSVGTAPTPLRKPTSDERTAKFNIRVRHGGLIYWCRR
jgi:hypothetical protein